jgi:hypothetical protein
MASSPANSRMEGESKKTRPLFHASTYTRLLEEQEVRCIEAKVHKLDT